MERYDYGIIGGGPAGYTAGMMLAQSGKSVILFEKDKLGGTCLNRGCIPTKSFLRLSEQYSEIINASSVGIGIEKFSFDFSKVIDKKNQIVERIRKSLESAVKQSGVKIIYSEACVSDENTILADSTTYNVDKIILATGSKPRELKGLEFDGDFILNSDDMLDIQKLPKSILIVGSGAIGIEWTRILSNFGVEVTLIEMAEHLIPAADTEVSKRIERIFKQKKIKYFVNDYIDKLENKTVTLNSGVTLTPDKILVATGRIPVCPECTNASVLGDACGEIQLAHYAIHQAKAEVSGIPFNKSLIPAVIYGEPEIAWVGLKEQEMDENCQKYMLPITALGKAWCDDMTDGFIKIITNNNVIVGAHIISKEASSLIHILLVAIQKKLRIEDLKEICFAHPTYAEGIFNILMNIE